MRISDWSSDVCSSDLMTHGDDDGLRVPPIIAPQQIVIVPMLRDQPEDEDILAYCSEIVADLSRLSIFGEPVRALLDKKAIKAANKRCNWVKKGAPVIVEVGGRDLAAQNVSVLRRPRLYNEAGKQIGSATSRERVIQTV